MTFMPGNKLSKGRPKGSLNQRTLDVLDTLARHNFNPIEALIECQREAWKIYKGYSVIYDAIQQAKSEAAGYDVPLEDKASQYLKIAVDAAKELASYSSPKLKAIDKPVNYLEGMSPEQKLEAIEKAKAVLEAQLGKE